MRWQTIPYVNYPLREKVVMYIISREVLDKFVIIGRYTQHHDAVSDGEDSDV